MPALKSSIVRDSNFTFRSDISLHGHLELPDNWVVGIRKYPALLLFVRILHHFSIQFSDRHGRTRVMGISIIGLLLTDFNFIITTLNIKRIPGGYWFLVVGPLIEGSLGGQSTACFLLLLTQTLLRYDQRCRSNARLRGRYYDGRKPVGLLARLRPHPLTHSTFFRSRMFSLSLGLLFTGMALGPTLGGLLIRFTGKTLSVFYVATALHFIYACLVWLIIPESLTATQMHKSAVKYDGELRETAHDREINPAVGLLVRIKRLFAFLSPLTVFMPEIVENGANPLKKKKRDWNLTLIAAGYAFTISLMVGSRHMAHMASY